ncbi:EcsC family protein [bacterium]|nr:EcsC family protein [bacterium]
MKNHIKKLCSVMLMGLVASAHLSFANPILELEEAILGSENSEVKISSLAAFKSSNRRVQSALEQAKVLQEHGDLDLRDRFLSLALISLENEEIGFSKIRKSGPRAAESSKTNKFASLYGEGGITDKKTQGIIGAAVDQSIETDRWFVDMLKKLGLLAKNYPELNDKLRKKFPHLNNDELADYIIKQSARLTAGVGFAAALPGIVPGAGTAAQVYVNIGTMIPDMIYMFKKEATMIFRLAELYGKSMDEEERVTEALILFGIASGVTGATRALEQFMENSIATYVQKSITPQAIKMATVNLAKSNLKINRYIAKVIQDLITKGLLSEAIIEKSIVSLIPLVGAGISGAMNYIFTKKVGQIAKAFYSDESTKRLEAINNLSLPKVELAMFRAIVKVINADGVQNPIEIVALKKLVGKFQHNRKIVDRMLAGDEELMKKVDYDISGESDVVKEQILQAITIMEYIDLEKGPEEIELHEKILEKFKIDKKQAELVEIRVKKQKKISRTSFKNFFSGVYRKYQKCVGSKKEVQF